MKKIKRFIVTLGALALGTVAFGQFALAQFAPGQILTAAQLNSAFANVLPLAGGTLTGPLTAPTLIATTSVSAPAISGTATVSAPAVSATTSMSTPTIAVTNGATAATVSATSTTDATSTSTGAITTAGGVGIAKQLRVGGNGTFTGNLSTTANASVTGTLSTLGTASFGNQTLWLKAIVSCSTDCSQTWSQSQGGGSGLLGATRSSDNSLAGSMAAQGVAGYAINDNTTNVQSVYAFYGEARRAAGAGTTQGAELDVINQGSVVGIDPYNMFSTGTTPALWLSSGRPDVTTSAANATAALGIINNNTAFENGIVFHSAALNTTTGEGNAIVLPQKDAVVWYGSAGNKVAAIRSDATTGSLRMIFANGQFVMQDLSGNTKFTFTNTGAFTTPSSIQGATVYGTNGVVLPVTTVASLPGCGAGTRGYLYAVTDAATPTYNGAVTGGGSTTIPVFCNGTSWTAH